ncbi:MAG TPA: sugar ABC transporter ATP-binding protein [Tepidisphaeraceae bacterium]
MTPLLQMQNISKRFGGVIALDNVSLAVGGGEIVALIGENGAGKSTLMKTLGGVHQPDSGEIYFDGKLEHIRSVSDASRCGVGFVHQELNNLDNLDIAANIFLGREPLYGGPLQLVNRKKMVEESRPYLQRLGLNLDPRTLLGKLSLAQQQLVEIAKALSQNARILVLDEPTSSLTNAETDRLLATCLELKASGVSIIYVTHRLGEILRIADRVAALRDGKNAGELAKGEITHDNMVRLMIGRDLRNFYVPATGARGTVRLEVKNLHTSAWPDEAVNFSAAAGEILGFAGLVGAGRSELAQTIFGVTPAKSGEIYMDGKWLRVRCPADAIAAGIYLAPEDRRRTGLLIDMSICHNVTLPDMPRFSQMGLIKWGSEDTCTDEQIAALKIKTPSGKTKAINLSGGNQQKVVLAKWLAMKPKVLIVDEPTRGIDVGAKAEIYRLLRTLADQGVAVVVISSDMEEVLGICDRIAVMHEGAIAGILPREKFSEQAVMELAVG